MLTFETERALVAHAAELLGCAAAAAPAAARPTRRRAEAAT